MRDENGEVLYEGYQENPERGCGLKVGGGFYAEAETSPFGTLNLWTWILGDGVAGGDNIFAAVSPRGHNFFNPAATIMSRGIIYEPSAFGKHAEASKKTRTYEHWKSKMTKFALIDHVGAANYNVQSFVDEVKKLGPSRRVSPSMAKALVGKVPIPIYFTHPHVPLFRNESYKGSVVDRLPMVYPHPEADSLYLTPTWGRLDEREHPMEVLGLYSGDYQGNDHWLVSLFTATDRVRPIDEIVEKLDLYAELQEILKSDAVIKTEQIIGASWITRVSYMPYDDDTVNPEEAKTPGVHWLNPGS